MYRSADKKFRSTSGKSAMINLSDNGIKDEGVESGEIYFYYVRAVDSNGRKAHPAKLCALSENKI